MEFELGMIITPYALTNAHAEQRKRNNLILDFQSHTGHERMSRAPINLCEPEEKPGQERQSSLRVSADG